MNFAVLDYETFFSDDFTLSKMSTENYIRDPRFEAHGAAFKASPDLPAKWFNGAELPDLFASIDWANTFLICHHHQFDGLILSHVYGCQPAMRGCTLSMARLLLGNHIGVSLDSVRKEFGLHPKTTPYSLFKGRRWNDLPPYVQQQVAQGACDEVESIWTIFCRMMQTFPREELHVVDMVVRMFTEPMLRADINLLADIWEAEERGKATRSAALGVDPSELQSAEKFAALLRDEGVEPEKKTGKKGEIYAFAKTDQFMRDLLEDNNDRVRLLAEARLGEKSTFTQTRAETFGTMAQRGPMTVYLRYSGAGTLRPTGSDSTNWLNLKRRSAIRKSLVAPDGYLLGPIDASQIECRVLHYLAGGPDEPVIQQFRENKDPYVDLSSQFYGEQIYKPKNGDPRKDEMEAKRGMGKQGRLMCGYGASGKQFKITAKNGLYGPPVDIDIEDADRFVELYRTTNPSVCAKHTGYWAQCERMIARLAGGPPVDWGPLHVANQRIWMPNGCPVIYDTLEFHVPTTDEDVRDFERKGYWRMRTRSGWKKMWGSKLTQNICEAVSRVIVSQAAIRIMSMGYRILNWPYDELLVLIPKDGREEQHLEICRGEMKREPVWLPGIPLDAEASLSERYSK